MKHREDIRIDSVMNNNEDRTELQSNLDCLVVWAYSNKIYFTTGKYKVRHLGTNNASYIYTMGIVLEKAELRYRFKESQLRRNPL